jgi:hypothetical protein
VAVGPGPAQDEDARSVGHKPSAVLWGEVLANYTAGRGGTATRIGAVTMIGDALSAVTQD